MREYSRRWSQSLVAEFRSFDLNGDGFITPREIRAVETDELVAPTRTKSPTSSSQLATKARPSRSIQAGPSFENSSDRQANPLALQAMAKYISRFDQDGDGVLVESEWAKLPRDYSFADLDGNGQITTTEFVMAMKKR